jgi:hypothetical protein
MSLKSTYGTTVQAPIFQIGAPEQQTCNDFQSKGYSCVSASQCKISKCATDDEGLDIRSGE